MWYAVQVHAGMEEQIRSQCVRTMDKRILEQCFVPYYEEKKKYLGAWHTEKKILFVGYVFMVSSKGTDLSKYLQTVVETMRPGTGARIISLQENEIELLKKLGIREKILEMSTGIIVNGSVMITEGPLTGMEACIRRIDRHKRKVWLEIGMFGRMTQIVAGLEITEKKINRDQAVKVGADGQHGQGAGKTPSVRIRQACKQTGGKSRGIGPAGSVEGKQEDI